MEMDNFKPEITFLDALRRLKSAFNSVRDSLEVEKMILSLDEEKLKAAKGENNE